MGTTTNPRIEHVVLLLLENRSFDHMLGFLPHPDPTFNGVVGKDLFNERADGSRVPATDDGEPFGIDPDHSHAGALDQLGPFGPVPHNGGFVQDYEKRDPANAARVMQCLDTATQCPVLSTLALEFAVCDHWFSSVPGETWPNRNFAHAATSDDTVNIEVGFYYDPTIFELIGKAGGSWHVYMDGVPEVWCFRRLWRTRTIIDFLLRRPARIANFYDMPFFFDHVANGKLPQYSFIEPRHNHFNDWQKRPTNSEHPGNNKKTPDDFHGGERLIRDVYQSLLARPDLFAKTLLVVGYDEHGGLYDHADAPKGVPPGDPVYRGLTRTIGRLIRRYFDWRNRAATSPPFDFTRLGARIPVVLVSPWIERNTVVHTVFDHASIPKTLRELFAPGSKPLSDRDRAAHAFHGVVDTARSAPRSAAGPGPDSPGDAMPDLGPMAGVLEGMGHTGEEEPTVLDERLKSLADRVHRRVFWRPTVVPKRVRRRAVRGLAPPAAERDTVQSFHDLAQATRERQPTRAD